MPVELAYEELGQGAPWVFLHGFPLTRKLWDGQRALQTEARLILPDLRGHGASPVNGNCTMDAMAEDVLALCDRLGIERFGLAGLSMGGYVALALQERAPGRVAALVLADTQAGADTPEAREAREKLARRLDEEGIDVLLDEFVPKLLSPSGFADEQLLSHVRAMVFSNEADAMAAALRGMAQRRDHTARLGDIACPVLVLVGEQDGLTPPEKARAMVEALPHARLTELPEAGHLSNLEAPDVFNMTLRGFMAEVPTEGALPVSPR